MNAGPTYWIAAVSGPEHVRTASVSGKPRMKESAMAGNMTRREVLRLACAGTAAVILPGWARAAETRRQPNFLVILTDQQSIDALSAAGNPWVKTPNMDRLAARGVSFGRSYCTYPLCGPARASLFSSRMPHEVGVEANDASRIPAEMPTMGALLREAGYSTAYAGKWHIPVVYPGYAKPGTAAAAIPGFDVLPLDGKIEKFGNGPTCGLKVDVAATAAAVGFLAGRKGKTQPFALVASILNPHDICGLPRNKAEFARLVDPGNPLPPLPKNFKATDDEPSVLKRSREESWTEEQWREYRGVYFRLVEAADTHVGRIMEALEKSGHADNTIVLFTSDHGEMNGSHQQKVKVKFYEEAVAVPLIVCVPGVTDKPQVDRTHLVSGLDIMPTLCDYAGAAAPASLLGRSLRPLIEAKPVAWRDCVVSELVAGGTPARMVRSARYKYVVYASGQDREQLFDLDADPGETKNLLADAAHARILDEHRRRLKKWCGDTHDTFKPAAAD
jgi:arylsulfatase A-like enzyme